MSLRPLDAGFHDVCQTDTLPEDGPVVQTANNEGEQAAFAGKSPASPP